jgi:aspartyl-tRNA(Asn)/glutamyl-tRNA(Gln) amidotransferase subunit A
MKLALAAYYVLAPAEASSNLARFDGVRYGSRSDAPDLLGMYTATRGEGFGPEVQRRILLGTFALSAGWADEYYGRAQRARARITADMTAALADVDLLLSPTSPTVAFPLGARAADPLAMYLADIFTVPASLAGLPSLSVPCGLSEGLPVGVMLTGRWCDESTVFAAGAAIEAAQGS